jgi:hypothetical protein
MAGSNIEVRAMNGVHTLFEQVDLFVVPTKVAVVENLVATNRFLPGSVRILPKEHFCGNLFSPWELKTGAF